MIWDKRVGQWVGHELFGNPGAFENYQSLGAFVDGRLTGGVVFHNWEPGHGTIEASAYANDRRWLTRKVINAAMRYVFDEIGCQMLISRQKETNDPARKIWLALGGSEIIVPRLYGRDQGGSIITLTDDAWRASKFCEAK